MPLRLGRRFVHPVWAKPSGREQIIQSSASLLDAVGVPSGMQYENYVWATGIFKQPLIFFCTKYKFVKLKEKYYFQFVFYSFLKYY